MIDRKSNEIRGWIHVLESLERWGYLTAGLSFLLVGMVSFAYGWYTFLITFRSGVLHAALVLTNDLLFVVILLELFRTIINFLKSHVITLEPFLYVGIIAATRRILTGGGQLAVLETMSEQAFNRYLWDIGLNVIIVLALILAVFIYNWSSRPREGPA
ncbi:MAG TPA: phosphate-starvation-inducible PsiE family protein [Nitrospiria bacterium]|nr:phosphate-starvation-inducible PsiE family protein [Nitrospiria bacterium]